LHFYPEGAIVARIRLVLVCIGLLLAGCGQEAFMERLASPADRAEAQALIGQLRRHQFEAIEEALDPALRAPDLHEKLVAMGRLIPAGEPSVAKLVGAHLLKEGGFTTLNTVYEYKFGEQWILFSVVMKTQGTAKTLVGFTVTPEAESLEEQNRFTFVGKGWLAYTVFATAILAAVLTLLALVACVRTRPLRRKWLWCVFIVVGFGKLSVNWTTGEWSLMPLAFQMFSFSAYTLGGPWFFSVSAPVGALWFLGTRELPPPPAPAETPAL
jgi:hypothetical protein